VEGSFRSLKIEAMLFGSANNGSQGDFLTVGLPQAVFDKAVVVGLQGDLSVLDDSLFDG
jgi:hypothetical protein